MKKKKSRVENQTFDSAYLFLQVDSLTHMCVVSPILDLGKQRRQRFYAFCMDTGISITNKIKKYTIPKRLTSYQLLEPSKTTA